ncbi:MAG: hypothetical protein ACE5GO_09630, partial [Anaerolineales bacterium]
GEWRFRLPYTAGAGQGAYINLYYLSLGHTARILGLPLSVTFTLARVLGSLAMVWALYGFFWATLSPGRSRKTAFGLAALGSGLGWLLVPFGAFTSDFWVGEAYPFLSAYDNPHFPLGLALILWLVTPAKTEAGRAPAGVGDPPSFSARSGNPLRFVAGAFLLSHVSPFGVAAAALALGGLVAWDVWDAFCRRAAWVSVIRQEAFRRLLWVVIGGAPVLFYAFIAIRSDPVLAEWDAQNLTPSPPWWDVIVSFSPALIFAIPGALAVFRERRPRSRLLLVWAGLGLMVIAVPVGLQRRFMMGLYIPLAGLAALGVAYLSGKKRRRARTLIVVLFLLALPTNLLVLLAGQEGARTRAPLFYLRWDEAEALDWIEMNTPDDALILAGTQTGLFIPAYTGRRVIYGHPFETVDAERQKKAVQTFFQSLPETEAGDLNRSSKFIAAYHPDYIFFGPREGALGKLPLSTGIELVYDVGGVQIYAVSDAR